MLRVIDWLKMSKLIADGAVQMCGASLRLIWKEEVGAAQKQAMAKALLGAILARQDGRQAVAFIRGGLKEIMQGDNAARRQCDQAAEEVLRVKVGPGTESSKAAWAKVLRPMGRANEAQRAGSPSRRVGQLRSSGLNKGKLIGNEGNGNSKSLDAMTTDAILTRFDELNT